VYTGRGPTKAKTTIDESMVTILLADTLTTGEHTLVDHGHAERVLQAATITRPPCVTTS
jgi:uncharacterized protein YbcI